MIEDSDGTIYPEEPREDDHQPCPTSKMINTLRIGIEDIVKRNF